MSLAALAFGANLFMYHNARVFIPIYSFVLLFLFRKKLWPLKKYLVLPAIISAASVAILVPIITSTAGQLRFKGTTIFADVSPQYQAADKIAQDKQSDNYLLGRIFHNRRFVYVPILIENYLSHLRPNFLFVTSDMDRHHAPLIGLLYLWDLSFILVGIYFLLKEQFEFRSKIIIFWWFLVAPIASSVTWGVPHSLRSEIYLPIYQIFTAVGFYFFWQFFRKNKLVIAAVALFLIANLSFYLHQYYVHMPYEYSQAWLYGRRQAALFTESLKEKYDRIIVSTRLEQPHEFWLYYLKYDPRQYLEEGGTVSGGFLEDRNKFDKYFFKPIEFQRQSLESKTLFVGVPKEFPGGVKPLKIINYLNGEPAIYIVDGGWGI